MPKGPNRLILDRYLDTAQEGTLTGSGSDWKKKADALRVLADAMMAGAEQAELRIGEQTLTGPALRKGMEDSATSMADKSDQLRAAGDALVQVGTQIGDTREARDSMKDLGEKPSPYQPPAGTPGVPLTTDEINAQAAASQTRQGERTSWQDAFDKQEARALALTRQMDSAFLGAIPPMKAIHGQEDPTEPPPNVPSGPGGPLLPGTRVPTAGGGGGVLGPSDPKDPTNPEPREPEPREPEPREPEPSHASPSRASRSHASPSRRNRSPGARSPRSRPPRTPASLPRPTSSAPRRPVSPTTPAGPPSRRRSRPPRARACRPVPPWVPPAWPAVRVPQAWQAPSAAAVLLPPPDAARPPRCAPSARRVARAAPAPSPAARVPGARPHGRPLRAAPPAREQVLPAAPQVVAAQQVGRHGRRGRLPLRRLAWCRGPQRCRISGRRSWRAQGRPRADHRS